MQKIFFVPPESSQAAGAAFITERFANLKSIRQPVLVVNGAHDEMILVSNPYWLSDNLPNSVLLTYPDSGHGSIF